MINLTLFITKFKLVLLITNAYCIVDFIETLIYNKTFTFLTIMIVFLFYSLIIIRYFVIVCCIGERAMSNAEIVEYKTEYKHRKCPICLRKLKEKHIIGKLRCGHIFHCACIDEWIIDYEKYTCPICRQSILT